MTTPPDRAAPPAPLPDVAGASALARYRADLATGRRARLAWRAVKSLGPAVLVGLPLPLWSQWRPRSSSPLPTSRTTTSAGASMRPLWWSYTARKLIRFGLPVLGPAEVAAVAEAVDATFPRYVD